MKHISHIAKKGFTLLELLIVIAVIAVLSAILIFILDPTETLAKARDAQRISDMGSLKTAIGIYLTTVPARQLDNTVGNTLCVGGTGTDSLWLSTLTGTVTDITLGVFTGAGVVQRSAAASTMIDGTGWVPVNLGSIAGGSPISSLPLDPSNTPVNGGSTAAAVTNDALMYRYACNTSPLAFEINAKLESTAFTSDDDRGAKDGGNNTELLEVGTNTTILAATNDF